MVSSEVRVVDLQQVGFVWNGWDADGLRWGGVERGRVEVGWGEGGVCVWVVSVRTSTEHDARNWVRKCGAVEWVGM